MGKLMASLGAVCIFLGLSVLAGARPLPAQSGATAGTASLSGTVDSATPFKAAQVFIRNTDKRILYMVYTNAGQFRAVSLFPGNYEVKVGTKGLESDVQKLTVKAGENPKLKLSLHAIAASSQRIVVNALETNTESNSTVSIEQAYDEVYPPGPGRDVAERTCIICHGENFLPGRPGNLAVWTARLDRMMGKANWDRAAASYAEGLLNYRASALRFSRQDREDLLAYLVKNFGPDAKPRAVRTGQDVRFDHDGNVWLTDRSYPHRLVKLDPRTGVQKDFVLPDPKNGIHEVNIDPSGTIWLAEHSGVQPSSVKRLLSFNPETEKFDQMIPMDPDNVVRNPIKWLQSIAFDSKSNIYVGWIMGGAISKYDRQTKKVSVFPVPEANAIVYGVIADRNDNIWMALWDSGNIAKFDTNNK